MSSTVTRVPDESVERTPSTVSVTFSREQVALSAIVVSQAVWLGLVMLRGWYSAADLPNLAYANGRDLDWDYLTSTLGGHFGVAQRLVYWLLNRAAPLEWWLTVFIRLAFQALTTVLLWRLFRDPRGCPSLALGRSRGLRVQRLPGARDGGAQQRPGPGHQPGVSRGRDARPGALHP